MESSPKRSSTLAPKRTSRVSFEGYPVNHVIPARAASARADTHVRYRSSLPASAPSSSSSSSASSYYAHSHHSSLSSSSSTSTSPGYLYTPRAYSDYTSRPSRSSLPTPLPFVPKGYWDFQMDTPRAHRARQSSLASTATDRSSFESRFEQRSGSFGSPLTSTRTSTDSGYAKAARPDAPLRATSFNVAYPCEYVPPRSTQLMRPQRIATQAPAKLKNNPGDAFRKLPKEILMLILDELRPLHLEGRIGIETCATCWMRDLCSLSLTNRKWAMAARVKLYEKIWLVGSDSLAHVRKRFRMKAGCRLKLLRRTLRENAMLASFVKDLKVPDVSEAGTTKKDAENYLDVVASMVMSCPNLERMLGMYPAYSHEFSRFIHCLSTRTKLVEHVWNITASPYQRQYRLANEASPSLYSLVPGPLNSEEAAEFLSLHSSWSNLATLVIHCSSGGVVDPPLLSRTIANLPSLQNLALSGIPTLPRNILTSLPPLKSLHLANLPSITPQDLSTYATCTSARTLTSLTLTNINLTSLPVLARLLSNLTSLERFSIREDASPVLPPGEVIFLHPYLASASLRHLVWDILVPNEDDHINDATRILAKAFHAGGFPALRTLKAPCDYDGILQSLCRPAERLASTYESGAWKGASGTLMELIDERRKDSGIDVTDSGYGSSAASGCDYSRSLRSARLAAQARIDSARSRPKIQIIAEDWTECASGNVPVTGRFEFGAYIGMVGSKVQYCLEPEVEGRDELGCGVEDLVESGEGKAGEGRRGACDGRWNVVGDGGAASGPKGAWEHRERPRWRPVDVGTLF